MEGFGKCWLIRGKWEFTSQHGAVSLPRASRGRRKELMNKQHGKDIWLRVRNSWGKTHILSVLSHGSGSSSPLCFIV